MLSVLPLPHEEVGARASRKLGRGCQQRISHRRAIDVGVNDVVDAINWMSGSGGSPSSVLPDSEIHASSLSDIRRLVEERQCESRNFILPERETIGALLKNSAAAYEGSDSSVGGLVPFDHSRLSVPPDASKAPELSSLLVGRPASHIEGFKESILNSSEEQDAVDASASRPRLYHDPILSGSPKVYSKFIRELDSRGLINYTLNPMFHVTVFFCA